jgi:hypothetical protein
MIKLVPDSVGDLLTEVSRAYIHKENTLQFEYNFGGVSSFLKRIKEGVDQYIEESSLENENLYSDLSVELGEMMLRWETKENGRRVR